MLSAEKAKGACGYASPRQQPSTAGLQRCSGGYLVLNSAAMSWKAAGGSPRSSALPGVSIKKTLCPSSMRGAAHRICPITEAITAATATSHAVRLLDNVPQQIPTAQMTKTA